MPGTSRGIEQAPPPEALTDVVKGVGKGKRSGGKENTGAAPLNGDAAPSGSGRPAVDRALVKFPLEPGTLAECRWRDGTYHLARVIANRAVAGGVPLNGAPPEGHAEWEYYVHYRKLNRRNDEWVVLDNFNLDTVVPPEPIDLSDPKARKRRLEEEHSEEEGEGHADFDPQALREHEEFTKVKNVERIELGRYEMETWYFSPLPPEFSNAKRLYFCEYDLEFFKRREEMLRHLKKVRLQHPPGAEIYRHLGLSMFEVDGKKARNYCQNLCYLAKLFLDHKTLFYDVDLFLFYVMCECDERGAHIVGYFSKEKSSDEGYNLACILTFPAYQRRGFGKFLISFSYELSKIEGKMGTPERPLSDLGLVSYRGYWTRVLLGILRDQEVAISIKELSDVTRIKPDDIISTLQHLNMIQYLKGQHVICAAPHVIEAHLRTCGSPGLVVDPIKIVWTPYDAKTEYSVFKGA